MAHNVKGSLDKLSTDKYKIVLVDCAYDTVEEALTTELLGKIAQFKIMSYKDEYSYRIIPFDKLDIVGAHFLLCEINKAGYEPIVGFKTITLEQCRKFNIEFPVFEFLDSKSNLQYENAIYSLIDELHEERQKFGYFGSWTIKKSIRFDHTLLKFCRELTAAMVMYTFQYFGLNIALTIAVHKLNVSAFHKFLGMQPLTLNGSELPSFVPKGMMNDECSCALLRVENIPKEVRQLAQYYQNMWDSRIEIKKDNIDDIY